jgi:hypothetical protein
LSGSDPSGRRGRARGRSRGPAGDPARVPRDRSQDLGGSGSGRASAPCASGCCPSSTPAATSSEAITASEAREAPSSILTAIPRRFEGMIAAKTPSAPVLTAARPPMARISLVQAPLRPLRIRDGPSSRSPAATLHCHARPPRCRMLQGWRARAQTPGGTARSSARNTRRSHSCRRLTRHFAECGAHGRLYGMVDLQIFRPSAKVA